VVIVDELDLLGGERADFRKPKLLCYGVQDRLIDRYELKVIVCEVQHIAIDHPRDTTFRQPELMITVHLIEQVHADKRHLRVRAEGVVPRHSASLLAFLLRRSYFGRHTFFHFDEVLALFSVLPLPVLFLARLGAVPSID